MRNFTLCDNSKDFTYSSFVGSYEKYRSYKLCCKTSKTMKNKRKSPHSLHPGNIGSPFQSNLLQSHDPEWKMHGKYKHCLSTRVYHAFSDWFLMLPPVLIQHLQKTTWSIVNLRWKKFNFLCCINALQTVYRSK